RLFCPRRNRTVLYGTGYYCLYTRVVARAVFYQGVPYIVRPYPRGHPGGFRSSKQTGYDFFPGTMYPILFVPASVNQRLPPATVVIPKGLLTGFGSANSVIMP